MSNNKKPLWGNRGKHHEMSLFGKKRGARSVIRTAPPTIPVRQPISITQEKETVEYIIGNNSEQEAKLIAEQEARLKAEEEARLKAEEEARLKAEEEARLKAEEEARLKAEEEAKIAEEEWQKNNLTPEEIEANKRYEAEEEETARLLALEQQKTSDPNVEEVYEEKSVSPGENLMSSNLDLSKASQEISENPGSEEEVIEKIEEEEMENVENVKV